MGYDVTERFTKKLPVQLSRSERLQRGDRLVELRDEIDELKDELKADTKRAKEKIADRDERIDALVDQLRTRTEQREIECEERQHFSEKRVVTVRLDTGEVVSERAMTLDELQTVIPGEEVDAQHEEWGKEIAPEDDDVQEQEQLDDDIDDTSNEDDDIDDEGDEGGPEGWDVNSERIDLE